MDLIKLENILKKAWSKETSYCPTEWSVGNPALGQCAITALIVNDYFGGDIVWAEAELPNGQKISHFFNLINGEEIDLTRTQFPAGTVVPKGRQNRKNFSSTREHLMSYENKKSRYSMLKKVIQETLLNEKANG